MAKSRAQLRILLMQIRQDTLTRLEELDEFVRYSGLQAHQFTTLDVVQTPEFDPCQIEGYDALFVGGSSDASVTQPQRYPFVEPAQQMLLRCLRETIPVFASCFGFQVAIAALGGEVSVDAANMEMGTYPLWLTDAAQQDLLFHDVPNGFWAVSGHKERATFMPKEATLLAYSDRCPYHAFKIIDQPFYGFQFHPEVNPQDLIARITRYQERYLEDAAALDQIVQTLQPETAIANQLIGKFVDRVLLA